jgi:hypothetical protein
LRGRAWAVISCGVVCLATAAPPAVAAPSNPDRAIKAAFAQLRSNLRHAAGLSQSARTALLATLAQAQSAQRVQQHPCAAIVTLEDLRRMIYRSAAPRTRGVYAVEHAILRTRGSCARTSREVTIHREPPIVGGPLEPLPRVPTTAEEDSRVRVPHGNVGTAPDPGPPTKVAMVPPGDLHATGSNPFAFGTIGELHVHAEVYPEETNQASAGRIVWYVGNNGAGYSLDGGATFSYVDPRRLFPEGDNAFAGDQVVLYVPRINRFVWYIQYWCAKPDVQCENPRSSNIARLSVASPEDVAADPEAAWTSWVIHPRNLGRRHYWFDYPDVGFGRHNLYVTSNMFTGGNALSAIERVPLGDLKAGRDLRMRYFVDAKEFSYKAVRSNDARGFFATHHSDTTLLTLTWDDGSSLLLPHRTPHSANASNDFDSFTGPNEDVSWSSRLDPRITASTRRGDELWLAWSEGRVICTVKRCSDVWPQPHVHVAVVDARSFGLVRERFIHNRDYAIGFPALATDALGRVGMTFSFGGGTAGNASPAAGYLTPDETFRQVAPSPGPGYQGDYFSITPDWPDGSRFTASGYVSGSSPGGVDEVHWLFYRYAR